MLRGTFLTDELRIRVEQRKINVWKFIKSLSLRMFIRRMSGEKTRLEKTEQGSSEYKTNISKLQE